VDVTALVEYTDANIRHEPVTKTAKEYARDEPDWDE